MSSPLQVLFPNNFETGTNQVEGLKKIDRQHKLAPGLDYEVAIQVWEPFAEKAVLQRTRITFKVIWTAYEEVMRSCDPAQDSVYSSSQFDPRQRRRDYFRTLIQNHLCKRQWLKKCTTSSQHFVSRRICGDSLELLNKMGVEL